MDESHRSQAGDSPIPWAKCGSTERPMAGRGVLLLGQRQSCSPGWAAEPRSGRDASAPEAFSSSVSCCHELLRSGDPPGQASGDNREGQPMALPHPCPWEWFAWQGNNGGRLVAEIRATALARALIAGGNWLQRCLAHAAEPGRAWAAGFGHALRAQLDARARHCHRGLYRHHGQCIFPPQSQAAYVGAMPVAALAGALPACCQLGCPAPAGALPLARDAPCSRGHGCCVSCLCC